MRRWRQEVFSRLREALGVGPGGAAAPRIRSGRARYIVYRAGTDELVCYGTAEECAAAMGMRAGSFRSTYSRAKAGTLRKWVIIRENEDG